MMMVEATNHGVPISLPSSRKPAPTVVMEPQSVTGRNPKARIVVVAAHSVDGEIMFVNMVLVELLPPFVNTVVGNTL